MRNCAFAEKIQIIKQFMAGASDLISVAFCALLLRDMEIMKFNAIHIEWIILSWQRSLCRLAFIFPPHQFYLSSPHLSLLHTHFPRVVPNSTGAYCASWAISKRPCSTLWANRCVAKFMATQRCLVYERQPKPHKFNKIEIIRRL